MHHSKMNLKSKLVISILLTIIVFFHCSTKDSSIDSTGAISSENKYLAQAKPGLVPEIFAPGIVSTELSAHSYPAFSPDGKKVYWSAYAGNFRNQKIYFTIYENGRWYSPKIAPFSGKFRDGNPCFSLDGNKLYFHSSRPQSKGSQTGELHYWFVEKKDTGWIEPKLLDMAGDSDYLHAQISFSNNGYVYFAANRASSLGGGDIYRSRYENGGYSEPENLGDAINSQHQEVAPFIAPDESYLIFTSLGRPGELGNGDLYISFKNEDGLWTEAKNMGTPINTSEMEIFAGVSPDDKFLFFTSDRSGETDVYWVDAKVIETLR